MLSNWRVFHTGFDWHFPHFAFLRLRFGPSQGPRGAGIEALVGFALGLSGGSHWGWALGFFGLWGH